MASTAELRSMLRAGASRLGLGRRSRSDGFSDGQALVELIKGGALDGDLEPLMGSPARRDAPMTLSEESAAASDTSAVAAVNRILLEALDARASDIHMERQGGEMRLRYRVDGILQDMDPPPPRLCPAILARVRVLGGMNLAEHRLPQDGRLRVRYRDGNVDLRVSTVPTLDGESLVLRVLDPRRDRIDLDQLGFTDHDRRRLDHVIARPHGMILATGPGGSGKSTSLYAMVQRISSGREKILTVEDPVEFEVAGVCQVPVNHKAGLTFATTLRSLVRQDPDVLLVGEIRDDETADIATHAALTGHLVLSTLHTTDSVGALARMTDLDVPDYLVAQTLEAVLAQRLVRRVCVGCAEDVEMTPEVRRALGPAAADVDGFRRGQGCPDCRGTGYLERTGLYELLVLTDPFRDAFLGHQSNRDLREIGREEGMRTLREDGVVKIRAGVTTPEEVLRVS